MKSIVCFILICIAFSACSLFKNNSPEKVIYEIPPGTIAITPLFFADQSEITNFGYCEYLFWTKRVLGAAAFNRALPDTSIWQEVSCIKSFEQLYLRHPSYRDCPVVGITYEQALAFTKWRNDRVMEFILIRENQIDFDFKPDSTNYFSIERYFSGNYKNCKPGAVKYYPQYRLPSYEEWKRITAMADSLNKTKPNYRARKYCVELFRKYNTAEQFNGRGVCTGDSLNREPFLKSYCSMSRQKKFFHLIGNAREMSNVKGIAFGGSWNDSLSVILKHDTFNYGGADVYTGFRNVCEWRQWKANN